MGFLMMIDQPPENSAEGTDCSVKSSRPPLDALDQLRPKQREIILNAILYERYPTSSEFDDFYSGLKSLRDARRAQAISD